MIFKLKKLKVLWRPGLDRSAEGSGLDKPNTQKQTNKRFNIASGENVKLIAFLLLYHIGMCKGLKYSTFYWKISCKNIPYLHNIEKRHMSWFFSTELRQLMHYNLSLRLYFLICMDPSSTFSWRRCLTHRKQSIDLLWKSMN